MTRTQRALALLCLLAVFSNTAAFASPGSAAAPYVDPRVVALMRLHTWCGEAPRAQEATPSTVEFRSASQAYALARQVGTRTHGIPAKQVAILIDEEQPTNPPQTAPTTAPSGLLPTPLPSGTPLVPIPPVSPDGPGQLLPPTPRPTGTGTPSPVPLPSTAATVSASAPIPIVRSSGSPSPLPAVNASPQLTPSAGGPASTAPSGAPSPEATAPGATPVPTLGPYQVVTVADHVDGYTERTKPYDLDGNVHIFYVDGQVVGDHAHWDGDHTLTMSGHTYLVNRNSDAILYADKIRFDTNTRQATLINGAGESTEGVAQGKLHYTAQQLTTNTAGVSHGDRASFTTCERPHAGYHVEARSIDVTPGDKLVARKAVVFLGPLAIFYLPLLIIPLRSLQDPRRRVSSFVPVLGYSQIEGFYVKARIAFSPSDTYYGYYTVEYYTKRGLKLGYTAVALAQNGRRSLSVDANTISDHIQNERQTNLNVQETENFSNRLRGQFGLDYVGDYGASISLPASTSITGSLIRQGNGSTENLTFSRFVQGDLQNDLNLGFVDAIVLSPALGQQLNFTYSSFNSAFSKSDIFHVNTITHLSSKFADYNLTYDKTDYSSNPNGYDRLPELQIMPHIDYGGFKYGPQLQFAIGDYTEPQNHFNTGRAQAVINESYYAKVLGTSDLSANYTLTQDYYGTGDEKAFDQQNAALTTPLGTHVVNAVTYNEQHPIGPPDVPFQLFDRLLPGSHSAQDVLRLFNRDIYSLSLATGTNFNRQAQPINYQFSIRPSVRSYVTLGGFYSPGPGNGFYTTNVQAITPFGLDTTLELSTNVDWKNKGRFENKNIYLTRTVDQCYNLQFSYNEDLKQFNLNVVILAFPGQSAGFGFGGNQPSGIIPQNFAF